MAHKIAVKLFDSESYNRVCDIADSVRVATGAAMTASNTKTALYQAYKLDDASLKIAANRDAALNDAKSNARVIGVMSDVNSMLSAKAFAFMAMTDAEIKLLPFKSAKVAIALRDALRDAIKSEYGIDATVKQVKAKQAKNL